MKKFIITVAVLLLVCLAADTLYYRMGVYIDLRPDAPVTTFTTTDENTIYLDQGDGMEPFTITGVNMGVGIPAHWATDYAIPEETYLRWFAQIQEMGANTLRVYTILHDDFYNAFYKYNQGREEPLYLIHGVWINDYIQYSHRDAYDEEYFDVFLNDCRTVVDLLHGNRKLSLGYGLGSGSYTKDVSPWVLGYILGVEWEDVTVAYTDDKYAGMTPYEGVYLSATADASPFESMLAEVGDSIIAYESARYKQQRLIAFSNWPTTDPFLYPVDLTVFFMKCAQVDVEHIQATPAFLSGQFASYHVYPYYPDYLSYVAQPAVMRTSYATNSTVLARLAKKIGTPYEAVLDPVTGFYDPSGRLNTYYAYLKMLTRHHTMPVVIAEFGVSTGRGMAQRDRFTGRNQGNMSEQEQGEALVECWQDIINAGCAGGCVFTWQDEWFKRTWNTMLAVDLQKTPYWSDYQTNEQYFGLLSFDPGAERSICYVDGDLSEWTADDLLIDSGEYALSAKYDEKFLYFLIYKQGFAEGSGGPVYMPLDVTPKSGSTYCENFDLLFERAADFVLAVDGRDNSRLLVQERYEVLRAMYYHDTHGLDPYLNPPDKNTPLFKPIELILQMDPLMLVDRLQANAETYETGLLTYGNANPEAADYNSLADFIFTGDYIELKLPWQLLNFSDPSNMNVHDDYYEHYGVENLQIDRMYVGIGSGEGRTKMTALPLQKWEKTVSAHERLKPSYYILQEYWTAQADAQRGG